MKEIVESLYEDNGKFNYDGVKKARENKDEISKPLLDELDKVIDSINEDNLNVPIFVDYSLFLLSEFKEKKACPLILKLLSFEFLDYLNYLGDGVMDKIPSILASVYDGNIDEINKIIENKNLDDFVRDRVFTFYQYLYENNLISKDELIAYLRKIIKLYNYEQDPIYNTILGLVTHCHLIEMIEDIKELFEGNLIDPNMYGGYIEFIDYLFDYKDITKEKISKITKVEDYMSWWNCFNGSDGNNRGIDLKKLSDDFIDFIENEQEKNIINYDKVGRNDPCPCGSGKKYKKCCLEKQEDMLPYQKYIDSSLDKYPKKNNNKGELDFYTIYKEEYINIDKLLYKAIKRKSIPMFVERRKDKEDDIDYNYLNEAYSLIKNLVEAKGFKTIDEYDNKVSIHTSLYNFFTKYFECMYSKFKRGKKEIVKEMEELIKYFYDTFKIDEKMEYIFLDKIDDYYLCTKKYEEAISFFESKLSNKYCKYDVLNYLFNYFTLAYDYDECISMMDDYIENETDTDLREYLLDLKFEFIES